MEKFPILFCFLLLILTVLGNDKAEKNDRIKGRIGAIVDISSRIGKEESLAMQMAIEYFNSLRNQNFSLFIRDSKSDPNQAALEATDLISKQQVDVLIGPQNWEEASLVAEVGSKKHIPVLSLVDEMPKWATERLEYLVQASPYQRNQMKAIAAIIGSWDWHLINVIYEDRYFSSTEIFSDLVHALKDIGAEISEFVALPHFDSYLLSSELERLRKGPSRVFVVHMSFQRALSLFEKAKKMGMMGKGYVWITTDSFTNLAHSFNVSLNYLLQGVIGIKSYFPKEDSQCNDFYHRFYKRFRSEHAEEDNYEPGIFAVQAYDAAITAALAMSEVHKQGPSMLEKIKLIDFQGLSGKIHFKNRKLPPANTFQIINVIGRGYRKLGFWSDDLGFSKNLGENASYNSSMKNFCQLFWPGDSTDTPRGWAEPTDANPLRIGVPTGSMFKQYVSVEENHLGNNSSFNGLAIDLFKAILGDLPFSLQPEFLSFNGAYDDLVEQIYLKKFDAAVGDVAIIARRSRHAEFTHPYTEAGLVMVVPTTKKSNKALLFTKPFTMEMWVLIALINVYNGFVIWLIERNHSLENEGSLFNQAGSLLCSSFTTLFSLHGNRLHSNLSRMTMVVWLFVALVITQIYTANLTSMLTVEKLEPTVSNIETLQSMNAFVGYGRGSFVRLYLEEVLHFRSENIKNYSTPHEYAAALRNHEISAAFLEVPYAKLFLARFCDGFMISGPTYKVGGFGYAFPRGSHLLPYVNEALLKVTEAGKLRDLENSMIAGEECEDGEPKDESSSLSPSSFYLLFVLSGGVSTSALTLYIIHTNRSSFQQNTIWRLMIAVMRHWGGHRRRVSRRVSDVPQTVPSNFPNATNLQIQV